MNIQVLGSGCPTCAKLNQMVCQAVDELKINEKVQYLTGDAGIKRIVELGIMSSPVLVVDEEVVMVGFTPDIEKIKSLIRRKIK